jgi:radical SAM protein with 4Fe4S-binding SPASM domain
MDIDTFNLILDEIKPFTDYIYLHVKGEPLIHPNLSAFLDLAFIKGFKVNITTNGTLIEKKKDILFDKKAIRQINISLHSLSGNKFNYSKAYINNILKFSKEISANGVYISLRLWNLSTDNNLNLLNERNNSIIRTIEKEFNIPFKIEEKVTSTGSIKLVENIYLNQDHEFQWPDLNVDELGEVGFCYGLRTHLGILCDGTVVPCCLDGEGVINLGNVKDTSFKDIIVSERALNIYNGFSQRIAVEELCRKCGYRTKMD